MKTFRSIVEAEVTTKEGRALVTKYLNYGTTTITDLGMSYERADEIEVFSRGRVDAEITNYVICKQFRKETELRDGTIIPSLSVEYKVPVLSKTSFYGWDSTDKENSVSSSALRAKAEVVAVLIDGKPLKMDKSTSEKLVNAFKNAKIKPITPADFAKKERDITSKMIIQYPEVKKAVDKMQKEHAKKELEKAKAEDEVKFKALKSIARKEKVDKKCIVLDAYSKSTMKYVIVKKGDFNYDEVAGLVSSFKENSWAAEGNYRDEEQNNKRVIEALKKLSASGIFVYHTGPSNHEVRVDI